jgi:cell wall-associated NlpC family hydrolase
MLRRPRVIRLLFCATALAAAAPASALAANTGGAAYKPPTTTRQTKSAGGVGYGDPYSSAAQPTVAGDRAVVRDGVAYAPANAPVEVQQAIWAGNSLQRKPYRLGGGHQHFVDSAYDCSGSVSFVLHAAGLLAVPMDSGSLMKWGEAGPGRWITVYSNAGHAYVVIAGLRLDTSTGGEPSLNTGTGPRWRRSARSPANGPFVVRHADGF